MIYLLYIIIDLLEEWELVKGSQTKLHRKILLKTEYNFLFKTKLIKYITVKHDTMNETRRQVGTICRKGNLSRSSVQAYYVKSVHVPCLGISPVDF